MAPPSRLEALLRLRRIEEAAARRELERARDHRDQLADAHARALAKIGQARQRLAALDGAKPSGGSARALERHEQHRRGLREQLAAARKQASEAQSRLAAAELTLSAAQRDMELALRGRQAVQAQQDAAKSQEARRRTRREEAAADDRWRPPPRQRPARG